MASKNVVSSIYSQIRAKILMSGPISVADYMRMALTTQTVQQRNRSLSLYKEKVSKPAPTPKVTDREQHVNPSSAAASATSGYYMGKDVFGRQGDFITSPEISQMFGEIIALWGLTAWGEIGGPKKLSIVELGPGRGTLAKDVIRVFKQLGHSDPSQLSLHLVEISPYLAKLQSDTLCGPLESPSAHSESESDTKNMIDPSKQGPSSYYHHGFTKDGKIPVFWYRDVQSLPKDFHFYIAHEFFDALPVHKLQKMVNSNSWREILVDLDLESEKQKIEKFRYVISRQETPAVKVIRNYCSALLDDTRTQLEISLDAAKIYEELVSRIDEDGGFALIIDYGHEGTKEDTFRAFRHHALHDPLLNPGSADLTADVDFSQITKLTQDKALVCGPITQRELLEFCGIDLRLEKLQHACQTERERSELISGYNMLMNDMGDRFKCMALFPKVLEQYRPKLRITAFDDPRRKGINTNTKA